MAVLRTVRYAFVIWVRDCRRGADRQLILEVCTGTCDTGNLAVETMLRTRGQRRSWS